MHDAPAYTARTGDILVRVRPSFLAGQSSPEDGRWVWAYQVEIENLGAGPVQVMARHWRITDGRGVTHEVRGPGVVGEQPVIEAGGRYSYASGCPLGTDSGSMVGSYEMSDDKGETFEAAIPAFSLDVPGEPRILN